MARTLRSLAWCRLDEAFCASLSSVSLAVPTHGTTRWENGDVYTGEHDGHGRPHGEGTMTYGGVGGTLP